MTRPPYSSAEGIVYRQLRDRETPEHLERVELRRVRGPSLSTRSSGFPGLEANSSDAFVSFVVLFSGRLVS